jgi:hypothetical protein
MKGVAAFIKDQGDGNIKLTFNDVEAVSSSDEPSWKHVALFTSNSYREDSLRNLSLSKEQFAEIGENLIFRLLAQSGYLK